MIYWGKTKQGKQRFKCNKCSQTGIKKRPDQSERRMRVLFIRYILGGAGITEIAKQTRVSTKTISRHFNKFWTQLPTPKIITEVAGLVIDATTIIKREVVVLIASDPINKKVVSWMFANRESYYSWKEFLSTLPIPSFVVSDAQKGLIKAVNEAFPITPDINAV
jgi:hypothetical protein